MMIQDIKHSLISELKKLKNSIFYVGGIIFFVFITVFVFHIYGYLGFIIGITVGVIASYYILHFLFTFIGLKLKQNPKYDDEISFVIPEILKIPAVIVGIIIILILIFTFFYSIFMLFSIFTLHDSFQYGAIYGFFSTFSLILLLGIIFLVKVTENLE